MRILFLAHRIPFPPEKGDKIRSYNVLKYLAERHQVTLLCPIDQKDDLKYVDKLDSILHRTTFAYLSPVQRKLGMLINLFSGKPLSVANFWSASLKKQLDELVSTEKFDAIYVFSSTMAEYVWDVDVPVKIIDFCDLDSAKFLQFSQSACFFSRRLYKTEAARLLAFEQRAAAHFDHILFISSAEKELFDSNGFTHKLSVMSNGVDLDQYFGEKLPAKKNAANRSAAHIAFTGMMDYLPNVDAVLWFCKNVLPLLRKQKPGLIFYIFGKNPVAKVRALHHPDEGIIVTGYVKDIKASLAGSDVFVAPIRIARGMQTKILEAMACGTPVVSSPASAGGIGAKNGIE
ncbi:MAG: TIGR03087 family PEP-CTERM/XrtA system glycosyltransferase, partial [Actinobacteria bacterium]|nr:TIGR03087 family PEP-CTERM/XrtA system glycosyltransferase [Actinomycetota bacterium]